MRRYLCFLIIFVGILPFLVKNVFSQEISLSTTARDQIITEALDTFQDRERQIVIEQAILLAEKKLARISSSRDSAKSETDLLTHQSSFWKNISQRVRPYLNTDISFTDNYNDVRSPRKSEITLENTLGAKFNFFALGKNLSGDIKINDIRTRKHPSDNSEEASFALASGFSLNGYVFSFSNSLSTNYVATPEAGIKVDGLERKITNVSTCSLGRSFNRFGINLDYSWGRSYYKKNKHENDNIEETFGLKTFWKLAPKSRLLWNYQFNRPRPAYENDPPFEKHSYALSWAWSLSPKTSLSLGPSYILNDSKISVDSSEFGYAASLGYAVSPRTNISFQTEHSRTYYKNKSSNNINTEIGFVLNHRLARYPKLNTSFSYTADFAFLPKQVPQKKDSSYSYEFGLDYAFLNWLDFGLSLTHSRNYSNSGPDNVYVSGLVFSSQARF